MLELNPYSHVFHNDPYPTYKYLRDEAPLYRNDELGFWALSRHDDVETAFKDFETYSNAEGVALEALDSEVRKVMFILAMDPPLQKKVRRLVSNVFTPRRVIEMEPKVRQLSRQYLEEIIAKGTGECDYIEDFAGRVPMDVISEMIGVPVEDRDMVRGWANRMMDRADGSPEIPRHAMEASMNILVYFQDMVKNRRIHPGEDDLTTAVLNAEVDGEKLSDQDITAFLFLMSVAGNETTTKLLGNALYWTTVFPEQLNKVQTDPNLIPEWVEETLRFDNSSQILYRTVTRDVEMHGKTMRKGDRIALLVGSANRDERFFSNPDVYDIGRDCNGTMSFGRGVHFCLGASLARLEGRICLEEVLNYFDSWDLKMDQLVRIHNSNVRGFLNMPMTFSAKQQSL